MAEAVRFELTEVLPSLVFKTSALNHSATLPLIAGNLKKILRNHFSCQPVHYSHPIDELLSVNRPEFSRLLIPLGFL